MDCMKSREGRKVCCVMQCECYGIVLHTLVSEVPSCWS